MAPKAKHDATNVTGTTAEVKMKRNLTLLHGVAIITGIIIGSGIFVTPVGVLQRSRSVGLSLIIWMISGLISILSALCFAELGTTITRSGGEYIYIMKGLGRIPAFMCLILNLIIIAPTPVSVSALALGTYILRPLYDTCDPPDMAIRLLGATVFLLLTAVNCLNVKWAAKVQVVFTACKLIALFGIIIIGLVWIGKGRTHNLEQPFEGSDLSAGSLAMAFYSGYWAFGGWNYLNFLVDELKDPERNLPRAIIISISLVTVVYIMANVAYMTVLSTDEILQSPAVAVSFAERTLGPVSWIMPLFVASSIVGAMNGGTLAISRVFFIGGEEGQLPELLSMIHVTRYTPVPSLVIMAILTVIMLTIGDIFYLLELMGFGFSAIFAMTLASLLYLRWKHPEMPRAIRMPILLPIALFLWSIAIMILTVYQKPVDSGICLAFMASMIPLHWIFVSWQKKPASFTNTTREVTRFLQKFMMVVPQDKTD
ncbi:large neutral amino acids transporter small subunit 1-like [Tubulanus polymorphus]|uniref:large neutral amino acids transporter small subunit 1-like n=1 Tax=Tubulanus polymorphus TaxID=672921 RepID=UPI003DA460B8